MGAQFEVDTNELEQQLMSKYGPLLSGDDLRQVLGYPSLDALRQAICRNRAPVPVFTLQNRRGKYALTKDVAIWLATQRNAALDKFPND